MKVSTVLLRVVSLFLWSSILSSGRSDSGSQDVSGLYTGFETGKFFNNAQETMSHVKGVVQGGKCIFFDTATNILYDGTLTILGSTVSGTAIVHNDTYGQIAVRLPHDQLFTDELETGSTRMIFVTRVIRIRVGG